MRHVQALLNWILLSTGRTDLKRVVVVVVFLRGDRPVDPPPQLSLEKLKRLFGILMKGTILFYN